MCNSNFKQSLKVWALTHNITHSAINDLLKLLKPTNDDLPVDHSIFQKGENSKPIIEPKFDRKFEPSQF